MAEDHAKKFDVFLSHSHVDAAAIEQIAARLSDEAQLHVWLDKWELVPSNLFRQGLAKGPDEAASCAECGESADLPHSMSETSQSVLQLEAPI
jgi:hypothetical protein